MEPRAVTGNQFGLATLMRWKKRSPLWTEICLWKMPAPSYLQDMLTLLKTEEGCVTLKVTYPAQQPFQQARRVREPWSQWYRRSQNQQRSSWDSYQWIPQMHPWKWIDKIQIPLWKLHTISIIIPIEVKQYMYQKLHFHCWDFPLHPNTFSKQKVYSSLFRLYKCQKINHVGARAHETLLACNSYCWICCMMRGWWGRPSTEINWRRSGLQHRPKPIIREDTDCVTNGNKWCYYFYIIQTRQLFPEQKV